MSDKFYWKVVVTCYSQTKYYEVHWKKRWWHFYQNKWCDTQAQAELLLDELRRFYNDSPLSKPGSDKSINCW